MASARSDSIAAGLLLLFAIVFNLVRLQPEAAIQAPLMNDGVLHSQALEWAAENVASAQNPSDPWLASSSWVIPSSITTSTWPNCYQRL